MREADRIVLRETDSPIGVLQLVVYRTDDVTWIGSARRATASGSVGRLLGATGLRTGSIETEVSGTVDVYETVACVTGAVTRRIVRAEAITGDGRHLPVEVVDIPPGLEDEYRALWAVVPDAGPDSRVVGYDRRGRLYDSMDPRNDGDPPSDAERFAAVREHAEQTLRYHATALMREPHQRRYIEAPMHAAAYFLALTDADALDPRTVMARRSKLLTEFAEDVKSHPWTPPTTGAGR